MKRPISPSRLTTLAPLLAIALGAAATQAQERTLEFSVDPRIELLAAVQILSGYDERLNLITDIESPYKAAMLEHFSPFAKHEAVKLFDEMSQIDFSFDAPPYVMVHLSDPPELRPIAEIPEFIVARAGGPERLERFLAAMRDFARASDFTAFFRSQSAVIEAAERMARDSAAGPEWIATLESYYGMRQHGYHIVLAPIFTGNYGPRVERAPGDYDLYSVVGLRGVEDGVLFFGRMASFRHLALHEFGHSFVNPTTTRFQDEALRYEGLLEPIRERMQAQAYGRWESALNEHILRAVTTRMVHARDGQAAGDRTQQYETNRGFIYVPALMAKLEEYEANRDRYPTFVDFYPRLLEVLEEFSHKDIVKELRLDEFRGPIDAATTRNKSVVVVIMPTAEADADAQKAVEDYVRAVHARFYADLPLLTDREALTRDLSENDVVAYGTLSGNLWLAEHADALPLRIEPDRVTADSTYEGTDLRVITAVPNPYNAKHGLLVYTAQRAADVAGINSVFHGSTDFVIARGTERLAEGFYVKEGSVWRN